MAENLWIQHSRLAELVVMIRQREALRRFFVVTQRLVMCVPSSTRILLAETLVGRYRNGHDTKSMIQLAHALGDAGLARDIAGLVPLFCDASEAPIGGLPIGERKARVLARLQAQCDNFNL